MSEARDKETCSVRVEAIDPADLLDLLARKDREQYSVCAYCGTRICEVSHPHEINPEVFVHAKTCPAHPMRAVEAERDEAILALKTAIGRMIEARGMIGDRSRRAQWDVLFTDDLAAAISQQERQGEASGG